jgi:putative spermidine/putrescine transport system permease protein
MFTVGLLFVGGMTLAVLQSIGLLPIVGPTHCSFAPYTSFASDAEFRSSLVFTFGLASVATALSAVLGLWLALSLKAAVRHSRILGLILQIPLALPHLVMALFVMELLAPSGLLARFAYGLGMIHDPAAFPELTNDRFGIAIIVSYVLKEAPFIALMVLAVIMRIGEDYDAVARVLGASPWQRLWHITLPQLWPALASSSLVVFAFISGAYETPLLLGRQYPAMLPVVAQRKFMDVDLASRPGAIAAGIVIAVITAIFLTGYMRLARALSAKERALIF